MDHGPCPALSCPALPCLPRGAASSDHLHFAPPLSSAEALAVFETMHADRCVQLQLPHHASRAAGKRAHVCVAHAVCNVRY